MSGIARRTIALASAACVLATASCSSVKADGPQTAITYRDHPGATQTAAIYGILHGDRASGCLWLTPVSPLHGNAATTQIHLYGRYKAKWPRGQVRLYKDDKLLAKAGDKVSFGGGVSSTGAIAGCPAGTREVFAGS